MHKVTFFPLGNADTCRIDLEGGKKLLFDYAHWKDAEDEDDLRIDLARSLREDLEEAERDDFDIVAFTHVDDDHIHGATDFFYLDHAQKYQDKDRIKIKILWVPAAVIIEEGLKDEAAVIRAEARHRLRENYGIRVFSRPDALKDWLENEGLSIESRSHLITDAGQVVPGFTTESDGIEFFVHSPFSKTADEGNLVQRNEASLVFQVRFVVTETKTRMLLAADTTYEIWKDIVDITKHKGNESRLIWDIFKLPHHCSYKALGPEKGEKKTTPIEQVGWLLEQGQNGGVIVSSSNIIPETDDKQPPHFQAAETYKDRAADIDGEFKVTMEHPEKTAPDKLVIVIDGGGATLKKSIIAGGAAIVSRSAPRAGFHD
jgi:hypothetical protein